MCNVPLFLGSPPVLLEVADPVAVLLPPAPLVALVLQPGMPVAVEVLLEPLASLQPGPLFPGPLVAVKVLPVSLVALSSLAGAKLLPAGHPLAVEPPGPAVGSSALLLLGLLASSSEGMAISH